MPRGPKGEKRPADVLGRHNQTETRPGGKMLQLNLFLVVEWTERAQIGLASGPIPKFSPH